MRLMYLTKPLTLALILCIMSTAAIVLAEGYDFVIGDLRVDLSEVYNARDYKVHLLASDKPSAGEDGDFTAAWLGVFLGQYNGQPGSGQFSQVILQTDKNGIYWAVTAEPGVTCLRGSQPNPNQCYGAYGDLVSLGSWHQVELVKYLQDDFWIARVYDSNDIAYDVARIWSDSNRIYLARSDTEEGYLEDQDPYLKASFYHWHPQYMKSGAWQDWPESSGSNSNSIFTGAINGPDPCPDHYGADPYWTGDPRAWFAGTGGQWCDVDPLFPATYTYLPDVKASPNGWSSTLIIQNNGSETAHVQVAFYDSDGNVKGYPINTDLQSRAIWPLNASDEVNNFNGSAVVYASEDVSVVVETRNAGANTAYAYSGMTAESGTGNAGFGIVGTTIDLPIMMRDYWDWYTAFTVQNAGSDQALVNITYYDDGGYVAGNREINVPILVNGTIQRDQNDRIEFQPNKMYSAEIVSTNGQPLAAVVQQRKEASPGVPTSFQAYNGFSSGEWPISTPSVLKNYYGWSSGLTVQNVSDQDADYIYVTYYIGEGNTVTESVNNVPKKASRVFYQPNTPGLPDGLFAARVFSNRDIAVVVNQSNNQPNKELNMSYNGFQGGTGLSWQPRVLKNYQGWTSSVVAQNVGSLTTDITLTYDDDTWETRSGVGPYEHAIFYQGNSPISNGEHWAQVTAGQPIVAIVNATGSGGPDPAWSYNGFNR